LQINPELFCYLSAVTRGVVTVNDSNSVLVVYTSYFQEVRAALLESRIVSIVGAKGMWKNIFGYSDVCNISQCTVGLSIPYCTVIEHKLWL